MPYRKPQFWIGIAVSVACLAAIFLFIDPQQIGVALRNARIEPLLLSIPFLLIYMILRAVRWRYMLQNRVSLRRVFHLQNIGYMLTQLLPLRIGDPARAVLVGSEPEATVGQALSTMVVERLFDMLAIVVLLPLTLTQVPTLPDWMREGARLSSVLALAAIAVVVIAANLRLRLTALIARLLGRFERLNAARWVAQLDDLLKGLVTLTEWRSALTLLLLSALPWPPMIVAYRYVMAAVGLDVSFLIAGFVVCAGALSIAAPSSPGMVGVFHAGVTVALTAAGFDPARAASFAFIYHALNFTFIVLLGVIGLLRTGANLSNLLAATRRLAGRPRVEQLPLQP